MRISPSGVIDRKRVLALPMFAGCGADDVDEIFARVAIATARTDEVLVAEGGPGDFAYILVAGTAAVTRGNELVAALHAGDLFGEMALVAGGTRTATVSATSDVELLQLDAQSLADLTGTRTIGWNILQALLHRMRTAPEPGAVDEPSPTPTIASVESDGPVAEYLGMSERVVVAPCAGVFRPSVDDTITAEGETLVSGQTIGRIDVIGETTEVQSPFGGFLMGMLALPGERVHRGQPIAWLRTF